MEKLKDLKDLLTHEIQDLYSAEEQIIEALPAMIEKAKDAELKKSLKEHLRITEEQKSRLDEVKRMLKESDSKGTESGAEEDEGEEKNGFLSSLFGGSGGSQTCRGMMGLIEEGQKIMNQEMDPDVLDAAIIASAQKIEHYEICGYGTARAFARQLELNEVTTLLEKTLNEEYDADDRLTLLATGRLNEEAESTGRKRTRTRISSPAKKSAPSRSSKTAKKAAPLRKAAPAKKAAKTAKKAAPAKKGAASKSKPSKAAASRGGKSPASGRKRPGGPTKKSIKSPGGRAGSSQRGSRGR